MVGMAHDLFGRTPCVSIVVLGVGFAMMGCIQWTMLKELASIRKEVSGNTAARRVGCPVASHAFLRLATYSL
jgi:hypothetical protein